MIFGWLGWSLLSTTCSSASSAYRLSSIAASRSSMLRRSASASKDWLVLVIWLVLILGASLVGVECLNSEDHDSPAPSSDRQSAGQGRAGGPREAREPRMAAAMLEIAVIGELQVQVAGKTAELPASRRALSLLGWLAVHPGRHPRSRLAGLFWPDVLDASARASLRSAIWVLRSVLGPDFGSYLAAGRDTVTLAGGDLPVDLREMHRLIGQGEPEAALALCRGDLLQELDDDWVVEARTELDRYIAGALRELTERARAAGDPATALAWARRRATLCPLDESAGAGLIRALVDAGEAPAALEAVARLQQRIGTELGVPVSAATAALGDPGR